MLRFMCYKDVLVCTEGRGLRVLDARVVMQQWLGLGLCWCLILIVLRLLPCTGG